MLFFSKFKCEQGIPQSIEDKRCELSEKGKRLEGAILRSIYIQYIPYFRYVLILCNSWFEHCVAFVLL